MSAMALDNETPYIVDSQHVNLMLLWISGLTSQQLVPCL